MTARGMRLGTKASQLGKILRGMRLVRKASRRDMTAQDMWLEKKASLLGRSQGRWMGLLQRARFQSSPGKTGLDKWQAKTECFRGK